MGVYILSVLHTVNAQGLLLLIFIITYARAVVLKCFSTDHFWLQAYVGCAFNIQLPPALNS